MARPQRPYRTTWGELVPGLYRCPDGRWRINSTGQKFTEPDERQALARFRAMTADREQKVVIPIFQLDAPANGSRTEQLDRVLTDHPNAVPVIVPAEGDDQSVPGATAEITGLGQPISETAVWAWVRQQLLNHPEYVAKMTGIPELAYLSRLPIPKDPLKLRVLLATYKEHADVKADTKREAGNTFEEFLKLTGAVTLADLTAETLIAYRDEIVKRVQSPGTIAAYFGRVKWIIAFGKTRGLDSVQIDAALSRMDVLRAPKDRRVFQPSPMPVAVFHALYQAAGAQWPEWQPRLLVMLNCCLHFDECLDLEWTDFDLEKATFCTQRNKRGRVIRAATLWPETLAALKGLKRTGSPYVFVSAHGSRFNAKGQWKTWNKLRKAAGHPDAKMDDIRDAAYTAACHAPGVEEKFTRLMAGHRSHGLQDSYVARNPAIVRSACDAVYQTYGPFRG